MTDPFSKFTDQEVREALGRAMARDIAGENKFPSRWYEPINGPATLPGSFSRK